MTHERNGSENANCENLRKVESASFFVLISLLATSMSKFSRMQQHRSDESARKHSKREQFDLLPSNKRCDIFAVTFDFYTPRAHFIILPRKKFPVPQDYNALDRTTRLRVVEAAKAMVSHFKLEKSSLLSVHLGSWISNKDMFHAHLCVDLDDYLGIFEKKKEEIPEWPSRKYVTRQWKASQDPSHYAINVRGYPFRTYFKEELAAIKNSPPQHSSSTSALTVPLPLCILYHPSEPKVGFAVEKSKNPNTAEFLLEVQEAIIDFATRSNLTNMHARDDNDGCHVCLVLDGKAHGFTNLKSSQSLVGYLQVTGPTFYRDLCPQENREEWFGKFGSMHDYKVYT